jgi:hypothetical protein
MRKGYTKKFLGEDSEIFVRRIILIVLRMRVIMKIKPFTVVETKKERALEIKLLKESVFPKPNRKV